MFVKRIKDAIIMLGAESVKLNLSACLRGTAQIWYTEGLSDLKKEALKFLNERTDR